MKQSSKRLISMLIVLVFLVSALIGFFNFVQPAYTEVGMLRGKAVAQEQLLATLKTTVQQAQALISSYGANSAAAAGIAQALPAGQDVAGALAQINGIGQADNLTITAIAVSAPVIRTQTPAASGASSTAANSKPAGSYSFKITATGNYASLKNFLMDLENNIRIFDVRNITIQPVSTGSVAGKARSLSIDYFTYNIVIQTYYQSQ